MKSPLRIFRYLVCVALFGVVQLFAAPVDEIEALLKYVSQLEGASFVRNGDVHTPKEAEAHLRLKWSNQKSKITTAEDFIKLCATKSSMSGQAYVIRFKDGHDEDAAKVLTRELEAIRAGAKTKTAPQ